MNKIILIGRTTKEIELTQTSNGIAVAKFTLAVNRKVKGEADFINCVAWRVGAETIAKYVKKGDQLAVVGNLQTRTYETNDGIKKYITEVMVEEFDFIGGKKETSEEEPKAKLIPISGDDWPF